MKWFHENFSRSEKTVQIFANSNGFTNNFGFLRKIMFFHVILLLLQEHTDEFAIKIPEDRTVAKRCVAIEVLKRSRPKSRNGVNASFTGVVTSNVKHVQKMSNLQSVNNYERNKKVLIFRHFFIKHIILNKLVKKRMIIPSLFE